MFGMIPSGPNFIAAKENYVKKVVDSQVFTSTLFDSIRNHLQTGISMNDCRVTDLISLLTQMARDDLLQSVLVSGQRIYGNPESVPEVVLRRIDSLDTFKLSLHNRANDLMRELMSPSLSYRDFIESSTKAGQDVVRQQELAVQAPRRRAPYQDPMSVKIAQFLLTDTGSNVLYAVLGMVIIASIIANQMISNNVSSGPKI